MSDMDPVQEQADKPPRKRRWGKIILTLSLALNLLFVGAIVGAGWMRNKHGSGWQGPPRFVVKGLLRHLPEEKQRSIVDQIARHKEAMRPIIKEIRGRKNDLKSVLRAEPFDADAVRAATLELKNARRRVIDTNADLLLSVLEKLTPQERREVLDSRLFRHLFTRRDRWGGRHR